MASISFGEYVGSYQHAGGVQELSLDVSSPAVFALPDFVSPDTWALETPTVTLPAEFWALASPRLCEDPLSLLAQAGAA
ncbi:hypothetical protein ABZ726_27900 [Streptomyces hundungensis]|uniref:hypothetical protein n=1 Tax=Streptomyces hundungensis TaxID=1077946 RepID=UPI0033C35952